MHFLFQETNKLLQAGSTNEDFASISTALPGDNFSTIDHYGNFASTSQLQPGNFASASGQENLEDFETQQENMLNAPTSLNDKFSNTLAITPPPAKVRRMHPPKNRTDVAVKEKFSIFSKYLVSELQEMSPMQCTLAMKLINEVVFYGKTESLENDSHIKIRKDKNFDSSAIVSQSNVQYSPEHINCIVKEEDVEDI